ncbi:MAG: hypothetical protein P4M13_02605 [Alphaproteobacteria bacterium]|nr:hypothetical protein [Alphaproteobacteria bacterium]
MRTRLFIAALAGLFVLGFGQPALAQFCNPSSSSSPCLGGNCSQLGSTIMDVDHKNIVACLVDGTNSNCSATAGNCKWRAMAPVPPTCASGYALQYSNATSSFVCVGITTINSCPAGQVMTGMTNGAPQCANTVTIPNCPSGQMMTGINDGQPVCGSTSIQCPAGQVLYSEVNGTTTCVANDGTYTCPSGQVLTGISNGVAQCATANGNVSCPAGQVMTGIRNGQAVCVVQTSCLYTHGSQLFTSSDTWTPPVVASSSCPVVVKAVVIGGGGGGGAGMEAGGGGSGYVQADTIAVTSSTPISVTVGQGGGGASYKGDCGNHSNYAGGNGTFSSFGTLFAVGGSSGDRIGNGGSGGGALFQNTNQISGGSNGGDGRQQSGFGTVIPGNGEEFPMTTAPNTVDGLVFSNATFAALPGGTMASSMGGGGGSTISINGHSMTCSNAYGHVGNGGGGGQGYGCGGGGNAIQWADGWFGCSAGGDGGSGAVYIEW